MQPTATHALLEEYLGSIYDRRDFAAHHRLHAAQGHLLVGATVRRARDLTPDAYATAMADYLRRAGVTDATWAARSPTLRLVRVVDELPGPDGAIVALAELAVDEGNLKVGAAFGLRDEPGGPRIAWATIAADGDRDELPCAEGERVPRATAARRLEAQAHGELAYVSPTAWVDEPLLTLLEASYWRQHLLPSVPLLSLPEARFTCHGTGRCCGNAKWTIRVGDNDRLAIEARRWPERLPVLSDRPLLVRPPPQADAGEPGLDLALGRDEHQRCVFLTDDNRCLEHADAGMSVHSPCHVFPYGFSNTPDGVAVWGSPFCPSVRARRGLPFADNEADIRGRLQRRRRRVPSVFYKAAREPIAWPSFRAVEERLLEMLGREELPVRQRLYAALRWLERWTSVDPPPFDASLLGGRVPAASADDRDIAAAVLGMFARNPLYAPLPPAASAPPSPFLDEALGALDFTTYVLRTLVFSKSFSFAHGAVPGFNLVVLAYRLLVHRFQGWRPDAIPEAEWGASFGALVHGDYEKTVTRFFETPSFRALVGSPVFGQALVRSLGVG